MTIHILSIMIRLTVGQWTRMCTSFTEMMQHTVTERRQALTEFLNSNTCVRAIIQFMFIPAQRIREEKKRFLNESAFLKTELLMPEYLPLRNRNMTRIPLLLLFLLS